MPAHARRAPVPARRTAWCSVRAIVGGWRHARAALVALALVAPMPADTTVAARPANRAPQAMVLTCIEASGTQAVAAALVAEVFRRNGLELSVEAVPAERASVMSLEGGSDGEVSRIALYFDAHPELVRVEPPLMATEAAVFVRASDPRFAGREVVAAADLRGLRVGIVRGVLQSTRAVASLDDVELVSSARQLHRMLEAGRLDAIVDSPLSHRRYRRHDGSGAATRQAGGLGVEAVFLGLQARHQGLARRLGGTIESMQASGEWDRFRSLAEDAYVERPPR